MKRSQITAMFMMDIDDFKKLNDYYGHVFGDECLTKIGKALKHYGETHQIYFYRYGGEEILGISFNTNMSADIIASELHSLIYNLSIVRVDVEPGVLTMSLGYTTDTQNYDTMIDKADFAMYQAKANGKNQVACYETLYEYTIDSPNMI